jgi:hypothetical protein
LTLISTVVLLMHARPIRYAATIAEEMTSSAPGLGRLAIQLAADAGAAILVLLVMTVLAVYKPPGLTPYGRRRQSERAPTGVLDELSPTRSRCRPPRLSLRAR